MQSCKRILILTILLMLILLFNISIFSTTKIYAKTGVYNQPIKYITKDKTGQEIYTELNFLLPQSWIVNKREDTEKIKIQKDSENYLTIKLESYETQPINNICYKDIEYKDLDSRITAIQSPENTNKNEYIFRLDNLTLNHLVTLDSINSIGQESGYSYNFLELGKYKNLIPKVNDIYKLCYKATNQGINNVKDSNIYKIESRTNNPNDLITIENILIRSLLAKNFEPDPINRSSALETIEESIKNESRPNLYVFVLVILFLTFFALFLLHKTKRK